jgi:hypothetical protein
MLVHCLSFDVSHFKLMFCVFYKDTQPFVFQFLPLYAHSDYFPSPPSSHSLLEYVEHIVRQMATLSSPLSSSTKSNYGIVIL